MPLFNRKNCWWFGGGFFFFLQGLEKFSRTCSRLFYWYFEFLGGCKQGLTVGWYPHERPRTLNLKALQHNNLWKCHLKSWDNVWNLPMGKNTVSGDVKKIGLSLIIRIQDRWNWIWNRETCGSLAYVSQEISTCWPSVPQCSSAQTFHELECLFLDLET